MNESIKISFVGDIFFSNMGYSKGLGLGAQILDKGIKLVNKETISALNGCDLLFGNLESPIIEDDNIVRNGCFASSLKTIDILKECGFNVISIANNHILEQGANGFHFTVKNLIANKIKVVGIYNNSKSNIEVIFKKGVSFGFAAFNGIKDIFNPNLHAELSLENIKATLDEMTAMNVDYKILSFHWGNEYINIPSYEQVKLARPIIDYGANIIVGHHPHVIQPIEKYKNGIIIYSLGNFIFDNLFSKQFKTGLKVDVFISHDRCLDYSVNEVQLQEEGLNAIKKSTDLQRKLERYNSNKTSLLLSPKKYRNFYRNVLFINRNYQRLLMKIYVLKKINNPAVRRNIIKVLKEKYKKRA